MLLRNASGDVRKASGRKNATPILFINTPEKGALWGGRPTLSENGLKTDDNMFNTQLAWSPV